MIIDRINIACNSIFYMKKEAQVIIVGGGHAGYEAALTSSHMGKNLMITMDKTKIGRLPCNPAVGGI